MKTFCGWGGLARPSRLRRSHTAGMQSKVHPTYKTKYRVTNWPAYNRPLVRRGDVTGRCCMGSSHKCMHGLGQWEVGQTVIEVSDVGLSGRNP